MRGFKPGRGTRKSEDGGRITEEKKTGILADKDLEIKMLELSLLESGSGGPGEDSTCFKENFGPDENPIGSIRITINSFKRLIGQSWALSLVLTSAHYAAFFAYLLNKEIEYCDKYKSQIKLGKILIDLIRRSGEKVKRAFPDNAPQSVLGLYLFLKEDAVFNLIKSRGPVALCHPDVQVLLTSWMSDKKNIHKKLGRLSAALLEYSLGTEMISTRFKSGPSEIQILRTLNNEIRQAHKFLTRQLGILKRDRKKIEEFKDKDAMLQKTNDILNLLKEHPQKEVAMGIIEELGYMLFQLELIEVLEEDAGLRGQYETFQWQPNKLAKALLMKSLEVSESKMDKVLYPNKNSVPIN